MINFAGVEGWSGEYLRLRWDCFSGGQNDQGKGSRQREIWSTSRNADHAKNGTSSKCCHTLRSINWQRYNIQFYSKKQNYKNFLELSKNTDLQLSFDILWLKIGWLTIDIGIRYSECHLTEQNFKIILELAKNSKLHLLFDTSWVKNGRLEQEMQIMQKLKSFKCCHTLRSINWQIYNIQSYPKTQNFEKLSLKTV